MPIPTDYPFTRYLAAKKSLDDRALNKDVWNTLKKNLPETTPERPLRVLEVGAGIGTMIERVLEWGLLSYAHYTAIDAEQANLTFAHQRLDRWATARGYQSRPTEQGLCIRGAAMGLEVELEAIDVFDYLAREAHHPPWDLLIAHAFLDLVDIPSALPGMLRALRRDGLYYFTLNFDGLTSLEPEIDPALDALIQELYHKTMDTRVIDGQPSGDSRSGRHLFGHLPACGAGILDAGASDWIIYPGSDGYLGDEAFFLHFIINTIHQALSGHPELDQVLFESWISRRHAQVERSELVYIAHQLDFVGRSRVLRGEHE